MRLRKTSRAPSAEINIAPLIDVVFLLIIFSMLVSQFVRVQAEELELPEATTGERPAEITPRQLVVNISADGSVVSNGRPRDQAALVQLLADHAASHADPQVLIRGDRASAWGVARDVMAACARRGMDKVRVAVTEAHAE